jgi:hypothetical protein
LNLTVIVVHMMKILRFSLFQRFSFLFSKSRTIVKNIL